MKLYCICTGLGTAISVLGMFASPASAQTSSCSSSAPCVYVKNTGNGVAISGDAQGVAILGGSPSNRGVYGTIGTGIAIDGTLPAGVVGENLLSGTQFGVLGITQPSGSGVGVYGDAGNSASAWAAYFNGIVGAHGNIYTDSNVYAHGVLLTSDEDLKRDVKLSSYGLGEILRLRPITFFWKDTSIDKDRHIGLVAQEVQRIVPELVRSRKTPAAKGGSNESSLALDYVGLIPLLIKAIQDQQSVISNQDARINVLENRRSSSSPGRATSMFALGLVPLGIFVWTRKKKRDAPPEAVSKSG